MFTVLCALQPIVCAVIQYILSLPDPNLLISLQNHGTLFRTHLELLLLRTLNERYYNMTLFSSILAFL